MASYKMLIFHSYVSLPEGNDYVVIGILWTIIIFNAIS